VRILATFFVLLFLAQAAWAGEAEVISGDTIALEGETIRLSGVEAPTPARSCARNGAPYPCGREAASALADLLSGATVECEGLETPRFGTLIVATCWANGVNLGRELVRRGWARVDQRYSSRYLLDEEQARQAGRGFWSTEFEPPWD